MQAGAGCLLARSCVPDANEFERVALIQSEDNYASARRVAERRERRGDILWEPARRSFDLNLGEVAALGLQVSGQEGQVMYIHMYSVQECGLPCTSAVQLREERP